MSSGVGILNRTYDNLEKRIARIESQLGRPRACKYGTTAERTAYGAPVDGVLWWDTTENVLYVWYSLQWILAKGVMVGGTTEREATSLPTAGGMWWDTDEDNLYVWGVSNSWQSVTGAKFGTREQRDAGGYGGAIWICSDEGYTYVYDSGEGNWHSVGVSVVDLNWLWQRGGNFAIMGHKTDYTIYDDHWDVRKFGIDSNLAGVGTIAYGQDGLVPYADFSGDGRLENAGQLLANTDEEQYDHTIMIWFMIHEYDYSWPQPIIGRRYFWTVPPPGASPKPGPLNYWLLYIRGTSLIWGGTGYGDGVCPGTVELNKWHLAIVRNGYAKINDGSWTATSYPVAATGVGWISYCQVWYTPTHASWEKHLKGKVSMYYLHDQVALTDAQIDMFYERTRRLHGV